MNFDGTANSAEYDVGLYKEFLHYVTNKYGNEAWFALPRDVASFVRAKRLSAESVQRSTPQSNWSVRERENEPSLLSDFVPAGSNAWRLQGKRVAMVLFSFFPGDPRPRRAAEALAGLGMSIDFICLGEDGQERLSEVVNGIDILRLRIARRRGGSVRYLYQYAAFLLSAAAVLTVRSLTRRYDLVYVHNMPDVLVFSALIPKMLGAKVILDQHDPMPELMMTIFSSSAQSKSVRLLKRLEKWSLGFADSVITVNRACAKLFASRSCPPEKISVVMNSPDEEVFKVRGPKAAPREVRNKPFVIMYHGSLVERNGLDLAVDAFEKVRNSISNAELRIYGSPNAFLDRVMASAADRGLSGSIRYLGPKSIEQIVEAIEECDVGIIPNQRNIFTELNTPTRIFEYLALGKPVIAPRAPGICDYFDDAALLFFELGDSDDLARQILYVFSHPEECKKVMMRGQAIHQSHLWSEERLRLTKVVANLLLADAAQAREFPQSAVESQ
jgi:glycosyltransferase involved in cell wall biosynthesis